MPLLDCGGLPVLSHGLHATREAALQVERASARLRFCRGCGLIFNSEFDPARLRYEGRYDNALHFSPRFVQYMDSLAARLVERHHLRGKNIVEIGCGDGRFLRLLCQLGGNHGLGFDPALTRENVRDEEESLQFVRAEFDPARLQMPADFICCRHVLEHLIEPRTVLDDVHRSLRRDAETAVYFEVPSAMHMLETNDIWVLLYEHCLHFTELSLMRLLQQSGFEILGVRSDYEDQFLCAEARPAAAGAARREADPGRIDRLQREAERFAASARELIDAWNRRLRAYSAHRRTVVLWGAGSRAVTFLNLVSASEVVTAAVDINPRKKDSFVAGSGHRIVAPAALRDIRPDVVLTMNGIYEQEVAAQLRELGLKCETVTVSPGRRQQWPLRAA